MHYCACETPIFDPEHDAGCRRCGLAIDFTPSATWTIVTDTGLLMFRDDIFTEDEAREHITANPYTAIGTPQLAVPTAVAKLLQIERRRISDRYDAAKNAAQIARTAQIIEGCKGPVQA